mgnify:CR=1 FL=1
MPETPKTPLPEIDADLTTVGKPGDGGCCYTNLTDFSVPTDATTKMSTLTAFLSLGELSQNAFTESSSKNKSELKGWHNTTLRMADGDESKTYKVEFVEVNRPSVAKLKYGPANVEEGADGSVSHIKDRFGVDVTVPLVFDELESSGFLRRTIVKKANVTSFDDVPHQRGSLMVYGMTFTVLDPGDGTQAVDIYRAKPAG